MKFPRTPHRWKVSFAQARKIQERLACQVNQSDRATRITRVAGVDCAFSSEGNSCIAAAVVWDGTTGTVLEHRIARQPLVFPYVPGFLSFREAPAILKALRKLKTTPDAIMVDGQGLAHPRGFGLACHIGVITQTPTFGCAKSRLVGEHSEPGGRRGSRSALRLNGATVGSVVRTRDHVKPVIVSVGHAISLPSAVSIVLETAVKFRLPEPTRRADKLVAQAKAGRVRSG